MLDPLSFVHSRLAMLDIFLPFFTILSCLFFVQAIIDKETRNRWFAFSGGSDWCWTICEMEPRPDTPRTSLFSATGIKREGGYITQETPENVLFLRTLARRSLLSLIPHFLHKRRVDNGLAWNARCDAQLSHSDERYPPPMHFTPFYGG
jgi:hypothetical protein